LETRNPNTDRDGFDDDRLAPDPGMISLVSFLDGAVVFKTTDAVSGNFQKPKPIDFSGGRDRPEKAGSRSHAQPI